MFWQPPKKTAKNLPPPYEFGGLEVRHFGPKQHISHRLDRTFIKREQRLVSGDQQTGHHKLDAFHLPPCTTPSGSNRYERDQFELTKRYSPSPGAKTRSSKRPGDNFFAQTRNQRLTTLRAHKGSATPEVQTASAAAKTKRSHSELGVGYFTTTHRGSRLPQPLTGHAQSSEDRDKDSWKIGWGVTALGNTAVGFARTPLGGFYSS